MIVNKYKVIEFLFVCHIYSMLCFFYFICTYIPSCVVYYCQDSRWQLWVCWIPITWLLQWVQLGLFVYYLHKLQFPYLLVHTLHISYPISYILYKQKHLNLESQIANKKIKKSKNPANSIPQHFTSLNMIKFN